MASQEKTKETHGIEQASSSPVSETSPVGGVTGQSGKLTPLPDGRTYASNGLLSDKQHGGQREHGGQQEHDVHDTYVGDGSPVTPSWKTIVRRTLDWTPRPSRYDVNNPPEFTVWLNVLFALVSDFPVLGCRPSITDNGAQGIMFHGIKSLLQPSYSQQDSRNIQSQL